VKPDIGGVNGREASYGARLNVIFWLYSRILVNNPWSNMSPGGGHPMIEITVLKSKKVMMNRAAGRILSKDVMLAIVFISYLNFRW
jgi:hypothetical protein